MLGVFGSIVLASVFLKLWRLRADSVAELSLGSIAVMIVVIWFFYFMHVRAIEKLPDQSEEKTLVRLSTTAYTIGFFAYLIAIEALSLVRSH